MRLTTLKSDTKSLKPVLFLDRDDVVNIDYGYVHSSEQFDFKPGIFNLVSEAKLKGFNCILVTNQAGIGRGIYSTNQFRELSNWMCKRFNEESACIDAIYYSPYHPTEAIGKYLRYEDTRKPGNGMFLEAISDFNIDLSNSIMVGDSLTDMVASVKSKVARNYLLSSDPFLRLTDDLKDHVSKIADFAEITFN